jgi:hypothetical protein
MVRAVAPKPLNVMMRLGLSLAELADPGVRRLSVGGAFARVMWASAIATANEIKQGRFDVLGSGTTGSELNRCSASSQPPMPDERAASGAFSSQRPPLPLALRLTSFALGKSDSGPLIGPRWDPRCDSARWADAALVERRVSPLAPASRRPTPLT